MGISEPRLVGARTVRALAMVAEVVHGAPHRFSDPARFSLAHGGKDRPFPVPLKVYDKTIDVMISAVRKGRLGRRGVTGLEAARRSIPAAGAICHWSGPQGNRRWGVPQLCALWRPQRLRMGTAAGPRYERL